MQVLPTLTPITARNQPGLRGGLAWKWAKAPGHAAEINPIPTLDTGNATRMLQCFEITPNLFASECARLPGPGKACLRSMEESYPRLFHAACSAAAASPQLTAWPNPDTFTVFLVTKLVLPCSH